MMICSSMIDCKIHLVEIFSILETICVVKVSWSDIELYLRPEKMAMEDTKENILIQAEKMFNRSGIKEVSMDSVASELSVSKKTLYQYFESKSDLINQVLKRRAIRVREYILKIQNENQNAIEEIMTHFFKMVNRLRDTKPTLLYDLKKYYFDLYQSFNESIEKYIEEEFVRNMKKGIDEGLYRAELNIGLVCKLHFNSIEFMSNPIAIQAENKAEKRFSELLMYHMRAVCTSKGIKELENLLNKNEK